MTLVLACLFIIDMTSHMHEQIDMYDMHLFLAIDSKGSLLI